MEDRNLKKQAVVDRMVKYSVMPDDVRKLFMACCKQLVDPGYNNYKNFMAELTESAAEILRRFEYLDDAAKLPVTKRKANCGTIGPLRDRELESILSAMRDANVVANGDLNYILFKYCKDFLRGDDITGFGSALRMIVNSRIRPDILVPYEDAKIEENGDV